MSRVASVATIDDWRLPPEEEAVLAGLVYSHAEEPGYTRRKLRGAFVYYCPKGKVVRAQHLVRRFNSLAIPPAWQSVWICKLANGHLQATGIDARGRKQYRYHELWRTHRDSTKFHRVVDFGLLLPKIRGHVSSCLESQTLSKPQVMAAVVRLLETTLIRIGNEAYAKSNKSYGLTTIRNRHIAVEQSTVKFHFTGKSGVVHDVSLHDRRLARIISKCQDLPGQILFKYKDDEGTVRPVTSGDINHFLQELTGHPFSAKDFRTWNASVLALQELMLLAAPNSPTHAKRLVKEAVTKVAKALRNTATVCRKSYIDPRLIEAYMAGQLAAQVAELNKRAITGHRRRGLKEEEALFLAYLQAASLASASGKISEIIPAR